MMRNYKVLFLSLFFILFLIMIGSILWVNQKVQDNKLDAISDNILQLFHHELEIQKSNALFLSVALSQDKELKEALLDEDEDLGYRLLLQKLRNLKEYTFIKDVRTQLLTKDLYIFARSWDNTYAGMPLEGFREDLQLIQKIRKPKVSIDPGRLLTIKATTPIYNGKRTIGYVEAIKTFDEITTTLRQRDIELTVLMYDSYLDVATLMRENPSFDSFVVSNKNYNRVVVEDLKKLDKNLFEQESYIVTSKFLHILDVLRDSAGEKIGVNVLTIATKSWDEYANIHENISFFLNVSKTDLYNVVESEERKKGAFKTVYDSTFINMLENMEDSEEKIVFEEEAKKILEGYTKKELIEIIIKKPYRKKIEGKIR